MIRLVSDGFKMFVGKEQDLCCLQMKMEKIETDTTARSLICSNNNNGPRIDPEVLRLFVTMLLLSVSSIIF